MYDNRQIKQSALRFNIQSGEIVDALAKSQSEFPMLNQDKAGYNYNYLTLPNILNELRPVLGKNGIAIVFGVETRVLDEAPFVVVETMILHKNENIGCELAYPLGEAPKGMTEIQWMGSIQSYLRRYGALAVLGIAGSEKEVEDIQTEIKTGTMKLNS